MPVHFLLSFSKCTLKLTALEQQIKIVSENCDFQVQIFCLAAIDTLSERITIQKLSNAKNIIRKFAENLRK